jgi:FMN phosphatase YigB (HAD superfamily)
MKILIDFDDVIFNTKQFREDLISVFLESGISKEAYDESYYDPSDDRIVKTYDPRAQIERLDGKFDVNAEKLLNDINAFMKSAEKYVFEDVVSFIEFFGKDNAYVISFGDIAFQEEKVNNSGIRRIVKGVTITDKLKAVAVSRMMEEKDEFPDKKIFFLDDRVEQIHDVKEKFPGIMTILVKRPEGRYQEMMKESCCDFEAHNLKEAEKIISQKMKEF